MSLSVEQSAELAAAATVILFSCFLGGSLGSFLNVVMHRVPRGESVARGGSRCPACGSPIRWHDNLPVLGWLHLGGRCRDCGSPISSRYPAVEAAAAAVGCVVGLTLLGGGRLLPGSRFGALPGGADALLLDTDWELVLFCLAHGTLLFLLLAWAICEFDRLTIPPAWFAVAAAVLGGLAIATGGPTTAPGWAAAGAAAAGAGIGFVVWLTLPNRWLGYRWLGQALVLTGLSFGWQSLTTIVPLMVLLAAARTALGRGLGSSTAAVVTCRDLLGAASIQLLAWRWLAAG